MLFKWFSENIQINEDKCHLIVSNNEHVRTLKLDDTGIENINCKNVLSRVAPYINVTKRRLLINSFFGSRFHYYPLAWMSYHRNVSNKINPLHEKYLRIVNGGGGSSFEDLLDKDMCPNICQKCALPGNKNI